MAVQIHLELATAAGIDKFFLTGHSMGGYATLAFLDLFHTHLSGYCLFHSHPFPDTPQVAEKRMREIAMVREGKKELFCRDDVNRMFADDNLAKFPDAVRLSENIALAISDEGIIGVLNGMMKRPSRLLLMEEGRVPGLWILGAKDNYIPCGVMKSRVNLPGNARLLILDNSGHMGFVEEKDLAVKELAGFIRNVL
jgi:pimeloyl-ACP methyl ester carboxylesterase